MSLTIIGGILGAVVAAGLLLAVVSAPPLRRPSLSERIAPYLSDTPPPSRLLAGPTSTGTATALSKLTRPLLRDAVRFLDRLVGGQASVRRRLAALDSPMTVESFRSEQVLWGALGLALGVGLSVIAVLLGQSNPLLLVLLVFISALAGILARDWWLSQAVAKRETEILAEFPVIAEMLALAVTAGEGPLGAIERITRLAHGHLVDQLASLLADTRSGTSALAALTNLRDRTQLEPLARFLDGMAVAIERGTPLADVLRAQAADVRSMAKRQLLETGGKKEVLMMVPVVFLVLPITILFAMFPGIVAITTVAQ